LNEYFFLIQQAEAKPRQSEESNYIKRGAFVQHPSGRETFGWGEKRQNGGHNDSQRNRGEAQAKIFEFFVRCVGWLAYYFVVAQRKHIMDQTEQTRRQTTKTVAKSQY